MHTLWAWTHGVILVFSRLGKSTDNAFVESLNGKIRAECLNAFWFSSLDDARVKCEAWRIDYNEVHPHSSIGNQTPMKPLLHQGRHAYPDAKRAGRFSQWLDQRAGQAQLPPPLTNQSVHSAGADQQVTATSLL